MGWKPLKVNSSKVRKDSSRARTFELPSLPLNSLPAPFLDIFQPSNNMAAPAFDRRRVNGPEVSFPPVYEEDLPSAEASSSTSAQRMTSLKEAAQVYARQDRSKDAFRPICESSISML